MEHTNLDHLYLKSYFEFFKAVKMSDSFDILYRIRSTCKIQGGPPYALNNINILTMYKNNFLTSYT